MIYNKNFGEIMTLSEVKAFYGSSYQFSKITGMHHANYLNWERKGYIPINTQIKLEKLSYGALKAHLGG